MSDQQLQSVIHPIDFRDTTFLEHDTSQLPDQDFITEAKEAFKLCDEIQEELIALSETRFVADGDSRYLDLAGDRFYFPESGLAFPQYSTILGIPYALAKKNPGELNEQIFHTHTALKTQKADKEILLKHHYNQATQHNELCAVLRGTFQTIKNSFIFDSVSDALGGHVIVDRLISSIDPYGQCYLRLLSPNFLPTSNDDKIFLAYDLQFSECADTGVSLGLGLWRQICSNGLAIPSLEGAEAYKHPYKGLDPTVPAYVLSRLLKEVVGNDAIGRRLATRRDELILEQMDLQTSLERLSYNGAPGSWLNSLEEKIAQDDTKSQWDLLNDLTQEAQAIINPRRRRSIEKCVGMTFGFTLAYDTPTKRKKKEDEPAEAVLVTRSDA